VTIPLTLPGDIDTPEDVVRYARGDGAISNKDVR